MEKSEYFGFNLPSRDDSEILADVNVISDNFRLIDETLHDLGGGRESDYSLVANALKGYASGEVVKFTDVSPLEHELPVKLTNKNLVNVGTVTVDNFTGYHSPTPLNIEVETGKTYTLSMDINSSVEPFLTSIGLGSKTDYLVDMMYGENQSNGRVVLTFTPTEKVIAKGKYLHIRAPRYSETTTFSAVISNIQLEEGTAATSYAPFVSDFSSVALKKYGKNLLDLEALADESNWLGNGEQYYSFPLYLEPNTTYTFSRKDGSDAPYVFALFSNESHTNTVSVGGAWFAYYDNPSYTKKVVNFTTNASGIMYLNLSYTTDTVISKLVELIGNAQIEKGSTATEYVPYEFAEYTPNEDGTVEGVMSDYPTTTLTTDTSGVIISAEYNKDTNKVIQSLVDAIISLGGNV